MNKNIRCIFSGSHSGRDEREYYDLLEDYFPREHFTVYPNVMLHTILGTPPDDAFNREDDPSQRNLLRFCSIDLCVVSNEDFYPICAIEVDGESHENEDQRRRDENKDRLLVAAGLPIHRVRTYEKNVSTTVRFHRLTKKEKRCELERALNGKHLSITPKEHLKPLLADLGMLECFDMLNEILHGSNYALFPKVGLQFIFSQPARDSLPEALQRECCLNSTVDFCVVSATSLPLVAFDINKYDRVKAEVFRHFGFPLLQLPERAKRSEF